MNLDSLSFAISHINYIVSTLNKKNYKSYATDLGSLVGRLGPDLEKELIKKLFSVVLNSSNCGTSNNLALNLLTERLNDLFINKFRGTNFLSVLPDICESLDSVDPWDSLQDLSPLKLLAFSLVLSQSSHSELCKSATLHIQEFLPIFIRSLSESKEFALEVESNPELVNYVLSILLQSSEFQIDVNKEQENLFSALRAVYKSNIPLVLLPYLDNCDETVFSVFPSSTFNLSNSLFKMDNGVPELIRDLGYGFTSSGDICRDTLLKLSRSGDITAQMVARIIGIMVRTHSGLEESSSSLLASTLSSSAISSWEKDSVKTWNMEVFISAVHELQPTLHWKEIIYELDHSGFNVHDRGGLCLLLKALKLGLAAQGFQGPFPVEMFYRHWKNTEGQVRLLQQILRNPDIFSFSEHSYHSCAVEVLKVQPDWESREISSWRSIDLIESLLYLAEGGQSSIVLDLMSFPKTHCPDVLALSLLQINQPLTALRRELLSMLFQIFLSNHPNSIVILSHAWHTQTLNFKMIVIQSMAEWYNKASSEGDCEHLRLTRILDVAQDLKALSLMLNSKPIPFIFDLAVLASRREYLKLEKWVTDQMREHGEASVKAVITYLTRKFPTILGSTPLKEEHLTRSQFPIEALPIILLCLKHFVSNAPLQMELHESVITLFTNCQELMKVRSSARAVPSRNLENLYSSSGRPRFDQMTSAFTNALTLNPPSSSSSSSFNVPNVLGSLVSGQGSPSRPDAFSSSSIHPSSISSTPTSSSGAMTSGIEQIRQGNISSLFPDVSGPISREIEDEANSYFQRIYNHPPYPTLSIDEVLDLLKRFQESSIQRERDVFNCMIKNLFEEYKYFPQYPEEELHTTAQLFGGIIEHGLVTMIPLGIALRFVLDAVRKPPESNMYFFGIAALDRFKSRLREYPQYCQHVSCIPHFKEFPHHLIEWVEYGSQSQVPPSKPSALDGTLRPSNLRSLPEASSTIVRPSVGGRPSIANTTNIDTLLNARSSSLHQSEVLVPSDKIQDKVAFIFNNLSLINMKQKATDLKEQFLELEDDDMKYLGWLAQYLVMKRASIEPNFHNLYSSFLEVLRLSVLYDEVLKETYGNIRILLRSDKAIANYSDRSLLKNLGHWLGLMTLARNRPILMIDLDIKPLIIEAYHNGQQELLYVVPFVAKVLESCAKSKVFKPPCPWTMGIMNLLSELHQEHDLKLNLKFEIEVLCKTLCIDLSHLTPGNLLKDYDKLNKMLNVKNFGLQHQMAVAAAAVHSSNAKSLESFMPSNPVAPMTHNALPPSSPFSSVTPGSAGAGMGAALVATPHMTSSSARYELNGSSSLDTSLTSSNLNLGPPATLLRQSEPKFHYTDINTSNLNGIVPHISVDSRLTLLKDQPDLIQLIKLAIEKSIQEWASPVIDRAIKIALTTCEHIVKKDCALDHNEDRLRQSAHHMVRNLTAGMAMITCRDHLLLSIKTHLKNFMITLGRNLTPNQTEAIEMTVSVIASDNVELACAFIQKKAIEKALPEIDKRLKSEYDARLQARKEGRRYCDGAALAYQSERMPESIRLKVGSVSPQQIAVYKEFAHHIPGFKTLTERETTAIAPKPLFDSVNSAVNTLQSPGPSALPPPSEDCIAILDEVYSKVEPFVVSCTGLPSSPHMINLQALVENLVLARSTKEVSSIIILIQKTVDSLLEGLTPNLPVETENLARYRDANLLVLRALSDPRAFGANWTSRQVTLALIESRDEIRYNLDAVDILIRSGLISLSDYDKHLANAMQNGENTIATAFAMHLCKIYLIDDRSNAHIIESDLFGTIEVLQKIASSNPRAPEGIISLMEMIKMSSERLEENLAMSGPTGQLHSGIQQAREFEDPPGLFEKTEFLLREWVNAYHSRDAGKDSRQAFVIFVQHMNQHGVLKTDDLITRFFRMSTQMCVDLCYRALAEQTNSPTLVRAKCFHTLDAYVRLITLLVKHSGETQNTVTKVNLLNKVLGIVAGVLLIDHDVRNTDFQQVPYHRIFIMLFLELNSPDQILVTINFQVLMAYTNMLHLLRPSKAPGFAYAWLEIVSHRVFMQQVLANSPQAKGWPMYAQLLVDLFKFLSPFLRNAELTKPVHRLYRGTLRVLLVLLHDFPEFLCDYHYSFCDVIPPNCVQMRNLILSAFPRNMRLPDPFTPNLKVDMLPEISIAPRASTNYSAMLKPAFKKELDSYLRNREPVSFLVEVRSNLTINDHGNNPGNRYNIQMINALVMHVGTSAIQYIRSKNLTPNMSTIAHSSHMDMFQSLAVDLETEGRYLFLNCIANQLRYPNSHTHYFSCTLLYLFSEANSEAIQEQITRVLLERLIVNRPHPWGLLITFIELIKNPSFKFWSHEFVHCAPEIQKLFESVARSCMVPSLPRDGGPNVNDNE